MRDCVCVCGGGGDVLFFFFNEKWTNLQVPLKKSLNVPSIPGSTHSKKLKKVTFVKSNL